MRWRCWTITTKLAEREVMVKVIINLINGKNA